MRYKIAYYDYAADRDYALELDRKVRAKYPDQADEARALISLLLYRYDKRRWLVFKGEAYDENFDLSGMYITHLHISSLLECRDKGEPVTDLYIERGIRMYLNLPFAVIEGGKQD